MKPTRPLFGSLAIAASVLAIATSAPSVAQSGGNAKVPDGWSYEIRNGRRVPREKRVQIGEGAWKAQVKQGRCETVKEQTSPGVYREVRKCD